MKKFKLLGTMLIVMILISGVTLSAINQGNHVSHGKHRNIELLTNDEVLDIVVNHLDIHSEDVNDLDIELMDEHYELSFDVDSITYNFKVHSTTGKIVEFEKN